MKQQPKIGLIPLYLKLYDKTDPGRREKFAPFLSAIDASFSDDGIDVVQSDICCVAPEFQQAVSLFERQCVDLIVAVHLAYSPSLEAADALAGTTLPLVLLDTTMDYGFGAHVDPARIFCNHGIHGVQDLASVLRRRSKSFAIVAGHVTESNVLGRAKDVARAAHAARRLRTTRALRIGPSFEGMGDFAVDDALMREALGIAVDQITRDDLAAAVAEVSPKAVEEEARLDRERFEPALDAEVHLRSLRVGLGLRQVLDRGAYSAFSMNFLAFDSTDTLADTVPFLEASKAMARGIGYAGEGDILTASLVGALGASFGKTTFTEIFCPDWQGGSLFVSHMGEINPEVAARKPQLIELDFPYTPARNPAIPACALAPGKATLVNLAPGPNDTFGLIAAEVEVLPEPQDTTMGACIRGWIRPPCSTVPSESAGRGARCPEAFLEQYSRSGGTHHSALVYGERIEAVRAFGAFAGLDVTVI
jgi:L-arabinose isomerase